MKWVGTKCTPLLVSLLATYAIRASFPQTKFNHFHIFHSKTPVKPVNAQLSMMSVISSDKVKDDGVPTKIDFDSEEILEVLMTGAQ